MNKLLIALLFLLSCTQLLAQATKYPVDSASVEQPGVPKGEVLKFTFDNSKIFPGTWREYWVYVPTQYKADKPACVYINQDGIQWKAPTVFDNLIYRNEMPVTIGVFVMHGKVRSGDGNAANDRYNRSFEYDGLGDAYARFILEEILPAVEKQHTSDGRAIHLSKNGNDRAIGGSSSGAVCAFTAAWEKPAEFSRVFSAIGTYIGLRGANDYSTLIRKYEPKPLRIFLQDGSNDLNIYAGDWWMANQTVERALSFGGYEVTHVWGEEGHNGNQGTAIFPAVMRWLWKDWPKPIATGSSKNKYLGELLLPGQDWELVGEGYGFTEGIAANAKGEVFFQDIPNSKTYKIGLDSKVTALPVDAKKASANCFGADGKRYSNAAVTKQIISYDASDKATVIANGIDGNDLVVAKNGNIYITVPDGSEKPGKLVLLRPDGKQVVVDEGIKYPNGVTLTPDQTQLYVTESTSKWVWIFSINADGTLTNKQRYGWLHVPDDAGNAWSDGLKTDTAGRVYVTSRSGIQIMDQLGRVNAIIPIPGGQASNCCFGGPDFNILYVTSRDKVYRRKFKTRGVNPFEAPYKPMPPGL
ncbi:SMP-30/gluconolactonase/LRE family protein [soil metagenome]